MEKRKHFNRKKRQKKDRLVSTFAVNWEDNMRNSLLSRKARKKKDK